jgi:hypothetical protein
MRSTSTDGATAQSNEVTPKAARPAENIRRSPKTSPIDPPTSMREPRVRR